MTHLALDITTAWRNALKNPVISLLIVVTLALGIGLNSAVLSVAWRVLLAPLPYADEEQLITLKQHKPLAGRSDIRWSRPTIDDVLTMGSSFSDVASYEQMDMIIAGTDSPWTGGMATVSWNLFQLLGVHVQAGRDFTSADGIFGNEPVMLLSHEVWQREFNGDPSVVGSTLELMRISYRVIGVLPPLPAWPHENDVWVTDAGNPWHIYNLSSAYNKREAEILSHVVARLRPDATFAAAAAELDTIAQRLIATYPDFYAEDYSLEAIPLRTELVRNSRSTFVLLSGLAILVVLIASANVTSLNLVELARRGQELAVREALGAPPHRIARQLLTESVLLALAGALLGLLAAWPALELLAKFASGYSPLAGAIRFDYTLLLCALGTALFTVLLCGVAPLFSRRELNTTLKEDGSKATMSAVGMRYRKVLMFLQFALAFAVLASAQLIVLSLLRLDRQDAGYDASQVLAATVPLNLDLKGSDYPAQMINFGRQAIDKITALPGVLSAAIYTGQPMLRDGAFLTVFPFYIQGHEQSDRDLNPRATIRFVTEDYFKTLDIALLQGRMFTANDDAAAPRVAIVNASAATLFPGGTALGQYVRVDEEWREVVGVVAEVRAHDLDTMEGPVLFASFWQWPAETQNLYIKTEGDPQLLTSAVEEVVHGIDPDQALDALQPLSELRQEWLSPHKLRAVMIGLLGLLALVITLAGIIGVIGYNVSQRVREIGIRMAIGATPRRVARLFVSDGMAIYGVGVALGLALMLLVAPLLQPLLYQTSAYHPGVWFATAVLLALAALGASWWPASKAAALNATAALRAE